MSDMQEERKLCLELHSITEDEKLRDMMVEHIGHLSIIIYERGITLASRIARNREKGIRSLHDIQMSQEDTLNELRLLNPSTNPEHHAATLIRYKELCMEELNLRAGEGWVEEEAP